MSEALRPRSHVEGVAKVGGGGGVALFQDRLIGAVEARSRAEGPLWDITLQTAMAKSWPKELQESTHLSFWF